MPRTVKARKPTAAELRRLQELTESEGLSLPQRRAQVLILHAASLNVQAIARVLAVHPNTAYADLRAFRQQGLAAVDPPPARGAPVRLKPAVVEQILRLAKVPPYELGLPYGRWSLATLRDYLVKHRILRRISREHLRQLLKKGRPPAQHPAQADLHGPAADDHSGPHRLHPRDRTSRQLHELASEGLSSHPAVWGSRGRQLKS